MPQGSTLTLPVPHDFDLARAVCSYGFFILAPNLWIPGSPATRALHRPLRGKRDRLIHTVITQRDRRLRIVCDKPLDRAEQGNVKQQIFRMLRIDENFRDWRRLHPQAKRGRFARLFRSPTLFEDIVKTITSCNVAWPNTRRMNALLCEHVGKGGFPSPRQLAHIAPEELKARCKVGYRAGRIIRLAQRVHTGDLDLAWFENRDRTGDEVYDALLALHGIGPYAAANICQTLGYYDRLPIDTETYRHYCETQGVARPDNPKELHDAIETHYNRYAPYQFLAYWFDLWGDYERFVGRQSDQWQEDIADQFTANQR